MWHRGPTGAAAILPGLLPLVGKAPGVPNHHGIGVPKRGSCSNRLAVRLVNDQMVTGGSYFLETYKNMAHHFANFEVL